MGGAARRRTNRVAAAPATVGTCAFCGSGALDETTVGRLYTLGDTTIHYYCALVSCGLVQRGQDEEGLFGFLVDDVLAELNRGKKLKCSYCGCVGATVGCCRRACRKQFHLPCGLARGSVSLFYGNYQSFCIAHAPKQAVPDCIMTKAHARKSRAKKGLPMCSVRSDEERDDTAAGECSEESFEAVCAICYEEVSAWPSSETFWPPCCARDRWFHTPCLRRMALSAGVHYLKCPLCNDKDAFQRAVARHGVYIPDRDAAWELEEEAFAELYERPKCCGADECNCYQGREYDADSGRWELKLCLMCGSAAAHAGCLDGARYICALCSAVPPPQDLDALERLPLAAPESERGGSPECRPLMSHRMSLRRTKRLAAATQRSASGARRDAFRGERVVRLHRADNVSEAAEVDIFCLDDPSSSKTDDASPSAAVPETQNPEDPSGSILGTLLRRQDTENTRKSRLSLGLKSPRFAERCAVEKYVAEVYGGENNTAKRNPAAKNTVILDGEHAVDAENNTSGKNTTVVNSTRNAADENTVDENNSLKNTADENTAYENNTLKNTAYENNTLKNTADENNTLKNTAHENTTLKNTADENTTDSTESAKAKPLDKSSLVRRLEDRILSPLKLIEEQIYSRLASGADREFRARMDEGVRRVRRPGPMCVKKKMIGDILENILADCKRGSAGRADSTVVDLTAAETTRASPVIKNPTSKQTTTNNLPKDLRTDVQVSPTKHSTPAKIDWDQWDQPIMFVDLSDTVDYISPMTMSNNGVVSSVEDSDISLVKNDRSLTVNCKDDLSLLKHDNISMVEDVKSSDKAITLAKNHSNDISSLVKNDNSVIPLVEDCKNEMSMVKDSNKDTLNDSLFSETSFESSKEFITEERLDNSLDSTKVDIQENSSLEIFGEQEKVNISYSVLEEPEKLDSGSEKIYVWDSVVLPDDVKKLADIETFKSQYLSEVDRSPFQCTFNHKHETSGEVRKTRIKTAIDFAIDAAVMKRMADRTDSPLSKNMQTPQKSIMVSEKAIISAKTKSASENPITADRTTPVAEKNILTKLNVKTVLAKKAGLSLNHTKENIDHYETSKNVIVSPETISTPEKSKKKFFPPEIAITVLSDTVLVPEKTNVAITETMPALDIPNIQKTLPVTPKERKKHPVIVYCKSPDVIDVSKIRTTILNKMRNNFENSEIISIVSYEEEKSFKISSRGKQQKSTLLSEMRRNFVNIDNVSMVSKELGIAASKSVNDNLRKKDGTKTEKVKHKKEQKKKFKSNEQFKTTYKSALEQNIERICEEMGNEIVGQEMYIKPCTTMSKKNYKNKINKHKRRTDIYIEKKLRNKSAVLEGKVSNKGLKDKVSTNKHLKNKIKTETYFQQTSKEKTVKAMGKEKNKKHIIYKKKQKTESYFENQSINKTTENKTGINEKNYNTSKKTDGKQMKNKTIVIDSELSEKETIIENERKINQSKKRKLEQSSNEKEMLEIKRKRQKINYSEEKHGFIEELSAINDFYLKTDKKKKYKKGDKNKTKTELKTNSTETKVLKQSVLNFSPETKKELVQESVHHKKTIKPKKPKMDISPDGLKQTSLKSFFPLHLTLN